MQGRAGAVGTERGPAHSAPWVLLGEQRGHLQPHASPATRLGDPRGRPPCPQTIAATVRPRSPWGAPSPCRRLGAWHEAPLVHLLPLRALPWSDRAAPEMTSGALTGGSWASVSGHGQQERGRPRPIVWGPAAHPIGEGPIVPRQSATLLPPRVLQEEGGTAGDTGRLAP